jgi:hypothetical protein
VLLVGDLVDCWEGTGFKGDKGGDKLNSRLAKSSLAVEGMR